MEGGGQVRSGRWGAQIFRVVQTREGGERRRRKPRGRARGCARVDGNVGGRGGTHRARVPAGLFDRLRDRVDLLVRVGEGLDEAGVVPRDAAGDRRAERCAHGGVVEKLLLRLRESISSCFRHHGDRRGGDHDVARAKSECRISKRFSILVSRVRSEDLPLFKSARLPNWGKVHSTSTSSRVWV